MLALPHLLVAAAALVAVQPAARFDLDTPRTVVRVGDPAIAPDGKTAVIIVSRTNMAENRSDSELVFVEIATKAHRVLSTRRGVNMPIWSPDGSWLGFLASVEGRAQIFALPMSGGEARQVTSSPTGVQTYSWRPDGRGFAYAALDEPAKKPRR